jgi:transposase
MQLPKSVKELPCHVSARRPYATDLSDDEWKILEPLVPDAKPGGRSRVHERRELLNAIFYVVRGGCAWRLLPHDFLPWQTAYHYFRAWRIHWHLGADTHRPAREAALPVG